MLQKTAAALRRNKYEVSIFETKEEAASYLNGLFQGNSIGFGDSKTLVQLGLYASLRQNNTVIDLAQFHDHAWCVEVAVMTVPVSAAFVMHWSST